MQSLPVELLQRIIEPLSTHERLKFRMASKRCMEAIDKKGLLPRNPKTVVLAGKHMCVMFPTYKVHVKAAIQGGVMRILGPGAVDLYVNREKFDAFVQKYLDSAVVHIVSLQDTFLDPSPFKFHYKHSLKSLSIIFSNDNVNRISEFLKFAPAADTVMINQNDGEMLAMPTPAFPDQTLLMTPMIQKAKSFHLSAVVGPAFRVKELLTPSLSVGPIAIERINALFDLLADGKCPQLHQWRFSHPDAQKVDVHIMMKCGFPVYPYISPYSRGEQVYVLMGPTLNYKVIIAAGFTTISRM